MKNKVLLGAIIVVTIAITLSLSQTQAAAGYRLRTAGGITVGQAFVTNDAHSLKIRFEMRYPLGYCLQETFIHLASSWQEIPQDNGSPAPELFDHVDVHDCADIFETVLPLDGWEPGDIITIAAHAVVGNWLDKPYPGWQDTGWAAGCEYIKDNPYPDTDCSIYALYLVNENTPTAPEHPFKNPDTYIYASIGHPETLDPHWTYETAGSSVQNNVYEGLVWFERERTDSFVPVLATSWGSNPTGDVWTFQIRESVTFHEGGTLEPHDVAYSMWRALLQDRDSGPQWMTHEMFFGTYSMQSNVGDGTVPITDADPADLLAACEMVKSTIVADDAAGTVTYYLNYPAPWFLAVMSNSFAGAVVDQEWMAANGDWDGSCTTWQNFHNPAADETILFDFMNGTGPYKLDYWIPGDEISLVRNESYWRAEDDPMWEGGPSGIPSIQRFSYLAIEDWDTRMALFMAGDADFVYVAPINQSQLEPYYGIVECADPAHESCVDPAEDGWIHAHTGLTRPVMTPAQFNWQINPDANILIGSGQLDGNGIPPDFFQDVHIRRAFSYCFDYETMIDEALDGEGMQAQGPIIRDMLGYRDDGFVFSYDPVKCAEEFQLSESGVWDTGFYMVLPYNIGNDTRRLAAEILKAGLEAVNPNFQIQVLGMPWPVLLNTRWEGKIPIYVGGWLEDFHDPHNWVHPFLHSAGAYARVVNMTEPTQSEFDALIEEAASYTNPEIRRPIYEEIQLKAQEEAVSIWMIQPLIRYHFSPYIQGWYFNPAYSSGASSYIYALDKVGP